MKYKISKEIKGTFILNIPLFVTGLCFGNDAVIGTSIVIFVVLASTVEILEAVFNLKKV